MIPKSPKFTADTIIAGRYRLVTALGSGGMGDVYRAIQEPLGREVALKVIRAENQTPDLRERFQTEVRAMAAVKHPHVATVFDFGRADDGDLYYAMELVRGANLREVLEADGPMSWPRVHAIVTQVAAALGEIHALGIMHRDLKPANIMINDGHATLVDFGLARQYSHGSERMTQTGIVLGTPAYLAPEQAQGRGNVDARCDLYSLGAVIYEMLSGRPPFVADSSLALLLKHVSEPVVPLRVVIAPELPDAVDALVARLLAKDPVARPANGRALSALLAAIAPAANDAAREPGAVRHSSTHGATQVLATKPGKLAASSPTPATHVSPIPSPRYDASSGERPTIAVLPFATRNVEDEDFAEGLAQDVITDLSKLSELIVIDSRSSFAFKNREVDTAKLVDELRVRYVVTGSLRRSGLKVRLTVALTDAETGKSLWSERFDRTIEDVFDVQDELTEQIVSALDVKLHAGEQARLWRRSIRTAKGREAFYRGLASSRVLARANLLDALAAFKHLVELEPQSALGYAHAAQCHWFLAWVDGLDGLEEHIGEARAMVQRALELDPECGLAYSVVAHVHVTDGYHGAALVAARRSAELCPNSADVLASYGEILILLGRHDEALAVMTRALRNSPSAAPFYLQMLGAAYRGLGRFHDAIAILREAVVRYPDQTALRFNLITNLGADGLVDEAREQARALRALDPRFDMLALAKRIPFLHKAQNEALVKYLVMGGVVDDPDSPVPKA